MKRKIINSVIILFVFSIFFIDLSSFSQTSNADEILIDKELQECVTNNYIADGMNLCIKNSIQKLDYVIDKYLLSIKNKLKASDIKYLNKVQKSWQNYYEQETILMNTLLENKKGYIYSTIVLNKMYQLKKQRAIFLKNYYIELIKND